MKTQHLIDWFWAEHERVGNQSYKDGFCQCESEKFIEKSSDALLMRAFLVIGVFIDQLVHSHHKHLHSQFNDAFNYPKNYSCQTSGMSSANWFIYSYHGYDKKISWERVAEVADIIILDTIEWVTQHEEGFISKDWVECHLYPEITHVFEFNNAKLLHDIISKVIEFRR